MLRQEGILQKYKKKEINNFVTLNKKMYWTDVPVNWTSFCNLMKKLFCQNLILQIQVKLLLVPADSVEINLNGTNTRFRINSITNLKLIIHIIFKIHIKFIIYSKRKYRITNTV